MNEMTGFERIQNLLAHKPTDRIGLYEHFWDDTIKDWNAHGEIDWEGGLEEHFGYDLRESFQPFKYVADINFGVQVLEESEDTVLELNGNGAVFRRHKKHSTTPEHVDFRIKVREDWEEKIKPLLTPDPKRISFESYRRTRDYCRKNNLFFFCSGIHVFEMMRELVGDYNFMIGMAEDPEWILDMTETYGKLTENMLDTLFEQEGKPDGIWYYDDLGYKGSPFISPAMYRELIKPAHKRACDHAHAMGLPIVLHSCGFVEPLMPDIVDAGFDMLQAIEIKSGMDLLRLYKNYGEKIGFMGGIDIRTLLTNDLNQVDRELEEKIPLVKQGLSYILHSDHSIPPGVRCNTYKHFVEKGLALGKY